MMEELTGAEVNKIMRGEHVPRKLTRQNMVLTRLGIIIPVPPKATHPNSRPHWKTKARAVRKQRADAATAASVILYNERIAPPKWQLAEIEATFYMPRKMDGDNLVAWLKASLDGLQEAGVVLNDSGLTVLPPKQITAKEAKGERKVVLVITSRAAV